MAGNSSIKTRVTPSEVKLIGKRYHIAWPSRRLLWSGNQWKPLNSGATPDYYVSASRVTFQLTEGKAIKLAYSMMTPAELTDMGATLPFRVVESAHMAVASFQADEPSPGVIHLYGRDFEGEIE